ncbi:hypothetical protein H5410_061471 [Solanum commersonii]|uniref:Uncharacterized protein n=1 Tax=Solanum commersonii TaxID=4109 RepID=A0A9J5W851_SOLCO|nr:hypothetical protein H5410_061471 [Solanum commersonii]
MGFKAAALGDSRVEKLKSSMILRYCKCEMSYNLDDLMVQCEGCSVSLILHIFLMVIDGIEPTPLNLELVDHDDLHSFREVVILNLLFVYLSYYRYIPLTAALSSK